MSREVLLDGLRTRIVDRVSKQLRYPEGSLRPDASSWVLIALGGSKGSGELLDRVSHQLKQAQLTDGRVPLDPRFSNALWPTPLAVLAWLRIGGLQEYIDNSVRFLLQWQGLHWVNRNPTTIGHDTSIPGWPWISGTHSWVEPTALGLLALRKAGRGDTQRCAEACRMILDRQLPSGGWNCGNTSTFGRELRPMPHSTGFALAALAGMAPRTLVAHSISYLRSVVPAIRSPVSLGWGLIGLTAWGEGLTNSESLIEECLRFEKDLPEYDLPLLSLLYCAMLPPTENILVCAIP